MSSAHLPHFGEVQANGSGSAVWRGGSGLNLRWIFGLFLALTVDAKGPLRREELWALKPLIRPSVPITVPVAPNPIDAFVSETLLERDLAPFPAADKLTWLRRVTFDLTGLPPSAPDQDAYLGDRSADADNVVVSRLLASEQHGVCDGRHWLDVLRYTDYDENMPASSGLHLWRDWVVAALNHDLPFDEFARAQICGNRAARRQIISEAGHLTRVEPRSEDRFALGFLARGATSLADGDQQLAMSAVETISTAFLGMTVGCAKCHDHFFDPILQKDYYAMKALFDPLVVRSQDLATADQIYAHGQATEEYETRLAAVVVPMRKFVQPFHDRLYEERLSTFPPEVQSAIRKPERNRNAAEQKTYEDYYPILRIDPEKIKNIMSTEEIKKYDEYLHRISQEKPPETLPVVWRVEEDSKRAGAGSFILNTGDPARPMKNRPVSPGFPFGPETPELREGRRESFADWLTAPENPLFARVAVNRVWQWHFGTGLQANTSDFGALGGLPTHPRLLDWLASEFIAHHYSLKWLHRLIVTSETYRRASQSEGASERANSRVDPENRWLWKYPLRRLEAEPLRDLLLQLAGQLDLSLGGKSYVSEKLEEKPVRRTAYWARGYRSFAEVMPAYLQSFDAEDGRTVCPRRNQTVTAPQALWLMNSEFANAVANKFAQRLRARTADDVAAAVELAYREALGRTPSTAEKQVAMTYLQGDPQRLPGFAWLLLNLDELLYLR